jgi:ATP synthase F1 delta subunit
MLITMLEDANEGVLGNFVRDIFHFDILCGQNFEINDTLFNPLRSVEEKLGWLDDIMAIYFDDYFYDFLKQLIVNEDIVYYEKIRDKFLEVLTAMQNCLYAKVTTAVSLTEKQMGRITKKLEELFGKQVFIYNNVSRDFSSGLLIECGNQMIDLEGRTALDQLRIKLNAQA